MRFLMMIVKIALSSIRLWRPSEDAAIARSRVNGCCSSFFSLLSPTGQVAAGHASAPLLFDFCLCESMSSQLTCVTQRTPPPRSGGGLHAADPAGGPLRLHVHRTAHPEVPRPSARPHPPDPVSTRPTQCKCSGGSGGDLRGTWPQSRAAGGGPSGGRQPRSPPFLWPTALSPPP